MRNYIISLGCLHSDGLTGYSFSHAGYWSGSYTLGFTDTASKCAAACDRVDNCNAFMYRYGDNKYCGGFHRLDAQLEEDANAKIYTKCNGKYKQY